MNTAFSNGSRGFYLALFILLAVGLTGAVQNPGDQPILLENDQVLLQIDPAFGTIARILDKSSGIDLAPAKGLAENYRLVLLMPDKKTTTIIGKDQQLAEVVRTADGLILAWKGPLKDTAGAEHKIAVRMEVKADNGELQFGLHLENGTDFKVQEAWYPMIGGLAKFGAPGQPADGVVWIPTSTPTTKKLELPFGAVNLGYPGQANMSFTCVQSAAARKSLYFAAYDKIARYKVYRFEEHGESGAKDVFACIQHMPFTLPGKSFDGATVVLRVVDGNWRAAGKVYRAWFEKTFGISKPAESWIRRESFFQMTMFELPEGTICYRFKDIPQWAKDAKDHGVNSLMISGWHLGGHDNGYPYYTIDPRLGTWQELEEGIKACHAMGMKVYFFVNYQAVMLDTDWYKNELVKYREHGPEGAFYWNAGWGMGTLWARMDHPKRMTWADPAFPPFRKIIVDQFAKLAEIGADGVHVDKMFPSPIEYNPDAPMSPDTATWEGAILLSKEVMAACRKHNPAWAMSFETTWDRMLQFGGATWWVGNQRITRSVFPENAETQMIAMAYDYLGVNSLVRDGHIVMVSPLNFCRSMGWEPWEGLADHIKEVKRIQDSLTDTVFLGEMLGHEGVQLPGGAAPGIAYNVSRNIATGRHACIFTNSQIKPRKQAVQGFNGGKSGEVRIHIPFQETKVLKLPAEIDIPAEGIVFVEEL
ncbi:MAG: hypothetical protein IT426_00040 [Pirellulales bacterium]|nr:hypothetical protein [Pirellulales bacterium]